MTTNEFVTFVRDHVGTQFTRVKILEATNRAQNEILSEDISYMRVKPDPFVTTSDGVYEYTATDVLFASADGTKGSAVGDVRAVREIYSFDASVSIFDLQTLDPASDKPNQFETLPTTDRVKARAEGEDSLAANSSDCKFFWWEGNNPGATTVTWRARAYLWPNQLTGEGIALSIPIGFQRTLLYDAVLKELEQREYGEANYSTSEYERFLKRFRDRANRMMNSIVQVATPRNH